MDVLWQDISLLLICVWGFFQGKSPSRLSKTPEDENQNQNAILTQEVSKSEEKATPDDDIG
jgi:hypothetical protein